MPSLIHFENPKLHSSWKITSDWKALKVLPECSGLPSAGGFSSFYKIRIDNSLLLSAVSARGSSLNLQSMSPRHSFLKFLDLLMALGIWRK